MIMSYCYGIPETKDISEARNGAGGQYLTIRYHSTYENIAMSRRSLGRVVAETVQTQRSVQKLQESAENFCGEGLQQRTAKSNA